MIAGKDISEKRLEEYSDVFADMVNVLLFDGEEVINPDDLEDAPTFSAYQGKDRLRKLERDVAKYWTTGKVRLSYIGLENQTNIYKNMPLRIIGYDGTFYRDELNNAKTEIIPVVTLVLYFGYERHWRKPLSLADCLKIPPKLSPYVSDYKMNLFEIAWLPDETVAKFKSDFKFVAEYFTQIRKTGQWQPMPEVVKHVRELFYLFKELTGDNRFLDIFDNTDTSAEGGVNMSSIALNKIEQRGILKGIEQVAVAMISEGEPIEKIQRLTNLSLERIHQLVENFSKTIHSKVKI